MELESSKRTLDQTVSASLDRAEPLTDGDMRRQPVEYDVRLGAGTGWTH